MTQTPRASSPSLVLVGLFAWLVPGGGYWLMGQRSRALVVGVSILFLFIGGILISGVRSLEVPGYSPRGRAIVVDNNRSGDDLPGGDWVMLVRPMDEIRAKPWSIAQIMAGPIDVVCSWLSLQASIRPSEGPAAGVRSHSRTNEIGVLYTAVAGMLNLLAIIDATYRAGQTDRE